MTLGLLAAVVRVLCDHRREVEFFTGRCAAEIRLDTASFVLVQP